MKGRKWMISLLILCTLVLPAITTISAAALSNEPVKCRIIINYVKNSQNPIEKAATGPGWATFSIWLHPPIRYYIYPKNSEGFSTNQVITTLTTAAETWDAETNTELFDNNPTVLTKATIGRYDGKNVIGFGNLQTSVIAVTYLWYTTTTIVEWDMKFNSRLAWGDAQTDPTKFDFLGIACHEFGHTFGMDDIYDSSYAYVTMYGYGDVGQTFQRTLATPDIAGLEYLYGP